MTDSARIGVKRLLPRLMSAEEAAMLVNDGMTISTGGFAAAGYPKAVLHAISDRVRSGSPIRLKVVNSSNLGTEIEGEWAELGITQRLFPFQMTPACAKAINNGSIDYVEIPLSRVPSMVRSGILGQIDVAVIEASRITAGGELVLTAGVGLTPLFVQQARKLIIEINTAVPDEIEGMHDLYYPGVGSGKAPIPIYHVAERIGSTALPIDIEKVLAVVINNDPGQDVSYAAADPMVEGFADNLFNFLELEMAKYPGSPLPPIQSGVGNMANNLVKAFSRSCFRDIQFFCGLLQEANIELMASGQAVSASASAAHLTKRVRDILALSAKELRDNIVLRPSDITNSAEMVDRMQIIALNSAIEIDMYGNANLSHIMGTRIVNGVGGGSTFAENAGLSMLLLPSIGKGGQISTIVPKVTVQDISSHHVDVIITDCGVADLRGKTPVEKARAIIGNCVNPIYKEELNHYLNESISREGGHMPQLLGECYSWHQRFRETGSMQRK